ncbi:MAG TPA: hypothetical protein VN176_17825, partial [Verrucomicrobiae bacterium]|nr:hypothetical protein [Verrucomicrobiae bacterium]
MIWNIMLFEVRQRLGRISTWMYSLTLFLLGFLFALIAGGAFPNMGAAGLGDKVYVNSPFSLTALITELSLLGLIIPAALAGQATYQDIDNNCDSFFYTAPIRKIDYLAGRFLGSLVTQLVIFAGLGLGLWIGLHMPFLDSAKIGPERLMAYLQPYLTVVLPNLVFLTGIFFCLAALGRKMLPVYAGSVLLLIGYLAVGIVLSDPTKSAIYALADPFGDRAVAHITQYWTSFEKNAQLVPFSGVLLFNRILWLSVGIALFAFTYFKFSRSQVASRSRTKSVDTGEEQVVIRSLPDVKTAFSFRASFFQFLSLTWLQFTETVKNVFFAVIIFGGFL